MVILPTVSKPPQIAVNGDNGLLTVYEVAALLQVSRWTVYHWAAQHRGPPAVRIGNRVRFERAAFDQWVADGAPMDEEAS
jgi:excisionase family DNA binding protein